jgi:thiamine biosynthesis lipoprotein
MKLYEFGFTAMASPCRLLFHSADETVAQIAAEDAIEEVSRIERKYSRYRNDSFLAQMNKAAEAGAEIAVDEETAALLDFAFRAYARSDGLFDISSGLLRRAWDFEKAELPSPEALAPLLERVGLSMVTWQRPKLYFTRPGMELDFGGIGKEYAVDRAAEVLRSYGISAGLVDLGGDIVVLGPQHDGSPWRIGIRHPRQGTHAIVTVPLCRGALATSGDYERYIEVDGTRYSHILNPRTGMPCHGLMAASVHAADCLLAGTLATIAMLRGKEAANWLETRGELHLIVDETGHCAGSLAAQLDGKVM